MIDVSGAFQALGKYSRTSSGKIREGACLLRGRDVERVSGGEGITRGAVLNRRAYLRAGQVVVVARGVAHWDELRLERVTWRCYGKYPKRAGEAYITHVASPKGGAAAHLEVG